jgi:hypothetical protein
LLTWEENFEKARVGTPAMLDVMRKPLVLPGGAAPDHGTMGMTSTSRSRRLRQTGFDSSTTYPSSSCQRVLGDRGNGT